MKELIEILIAHFEKHPYTVVRPRNPQMCVLANWLNASSVDSRMIILEDGKKRYPTYEETIIIHWFDKFSTYNDDAEFTGESIVRLLKRDFAYLFTPDGGDAA